ncbi:MAG: ROK family protein [Blautia sp.]
MDPDGPLCVCGNHGCLEALISEPKLKERIAEFGEIPSLSSRSQITFSDLGKAATFRDPVALSMVDEIARELSLALGNLICMDSPSLIILGGKIPDLGEYFLEQVRENLKKTGFRRMVDNVQIRYSRLQSDSFLNGAMKYFLISIILSQMKILQDFLSDKEVIIMKKLKIAIVGCGRISVSYADSFRRLADEIELVYAVDKVPEKAKQFADEFGCAWTTDFDEILDKEIDVVHLCLPHFLHPVMAIKAMKAGINVLTEKPIAISLQDADRMLAVQKETGVKLGCIFQTRYTKSVEKLKEMIARGDFGKILTARSYLTWNRPLDYYDGSDWKGTWDKEGGGVLIDQAIHSIDRVRYMLGSDVEWIDGSIHNYAHKFVKVEDSADAAIQFKNGCLYNLFACNIYGDNSPINIEFIGEKGAAA